MAARAGAISSIVAIPGLIAAAALLVEHRAEPAGGDGGAALPRVAAH